MVLVAYATAGWFQVGLDVLLQSALGYWAQIRSGTIIHDGGSWSGWDWDCVWCHVGVTVVVLDGWSQCLLGYRYHAGIPSSSEVEA